MTLPFYFVLAQCFHKFRLGVELTVIFFKGLCFHVLFPVSCFSVHLLATWLGPPHDVGLGHAWPVTPVAGLFTEQQMHPEHFPHPLSQMFYIFGPEQHFGWCDEKPLKTIWWPLLWGGGVAEVTRKMSHLFLMGWQVQFRVPGPHRNSEFIFQLHSTF